MFKPSVNIPIPKEKMRTKEGMIRPKQDQTPTQQTSNSAAIWWPSAAHDRISWAPRALRSFTCPAVPRGIHLASLFTRICKLLAFLNRYFIPRILSSTSHLNGSLEPRLHETPQSWIFHSCKASITWMTLSGSAAAQEGSFPRSRRHSCSSGCELTQKTTSPASFFPKQETFSTLSLEPPL